MSKGIFYWLLFCITWGLVFTHSEVKSQHLIISDEEEEKKEEKTPPTSGSISDDIALPYVVDESYKPFILHLDGSGNKYVRFINWNQFLLTGQRNDNDRISITPSLRRVRFLNYAQINDRFMILTHFGVNNVPAEQMHPTGNSMEVKLFLHDAWSEYKVFGEYLSIGTGLHYYNGLSRITGGGTINFMTYDNYRQAWSQLGLSDQFGRHLGVFAKGRIGKLNYRLSFDDAISNSLDVPGFTGERNTTSYIGRKFFPDKASRLFQGYFDYQFLEQESNKLPFRAGSHLGVQKVFNIGFGFISHPNGVVHIDRDSIVHHQDVRHLAVDVFYDAPTPAGGAINFYAVYYNFDYGTNYLYRGIYGTGTSLYTHLGYMLPKFTDAAFFMPYVSYSNRNFDAHLNLSNTMSAGINFFITGHHGKITLEYKSQQASFNDMRPSRDNQLIIQAMVFL
ncbi:MAG: hypothetical protein JJU28_11430 [Cyclobacteriaceae bacterium]|nr:hypothetical protein [Cyclobacteriaceae bacterium]